MNDKISTGDKYLDCDGEELHVLRIGDETVVLRSAEDELLVADMDDFLQDIASGELVQFK